MWSSSCNWSCHLVKVTIIHCLCTLHIGELIGGVVKNTIPATFKFFLGVGGGGSTEPGLLLCVSVLQVQTEPGALILPAQGWASTEGRAQSPLPPSPQEAALLEAAPFLAGAVGVYWRI